MEKLSFHQNKISTLIGLTIGIFLLNLFLPDKKSDIIFEELALGENNKKSITAKDDKVIHCADLRDLKKCTENYKKTKNKMPVILWLGNSQLHTVNQPKHDDELSSLKLHRKLIKFGMYTVTFSQPNANLQEHYLLFAHLLNQLPIDILILPVFFDDMREDMLRPNIKSILNNSHTLENIDKTFTGKNLISLIDEKDTVGNQSKIEKNTPQNNWEDHLNRKLANIWPLWSKRDNLRGIFFGVLYQLRNSVFGITATTTRKMIKGPYVKNQRAYEDILSLALENKIKLLVYIPPLRNDVKIPYNLNEYKNFKIKTKDTADKYNANFVSLENIIPGELWASKGSTNLKKDLELDFMHFKGDGHRILAEALFVEIRKITE